ncbi:MAG: hypothetical protein ABII64_08150 [Elusimicrobiota bacterium]
MIKKRIGFKWFHAVIFLWAAICTNALFIAAEAGQNGGVNVSTEKQYTDTAMGKLYYGFKIYAYNANPYAVNFYIWTDGNRYRNVEFKVYNMRIEPRQTVLVGYAYAAGIDYDGYVKGDWEYNYKYQYEPVKDFGPLKKQKNK